VPDEHTAAAIRAAVGDDWLVFDDLARQNESDLRRILRSHRDVGFTSEGTADLMRLRRRLDNALDRLMVIEVGIEMGLLDETALPDGDSLRRMLQSTAFARYANAYLYFGVRFVARRILGPSSLVFTHDEHAGLNELPVGLPCPPHVESSYGTEAAGAIQSWLVECGRPEAFEDIQAALDLLDDIVTIPGEQAEYELWLRGLSSYPEDDPHFQRVTRGLLEFASAKAQFYIRLEGEARLTAWRALGFAGDAWTARHPLTARFGILDLYWLARLLRAEVSSTGIVSYRRESWLARLAARAPEGREQSQTIAQIDEVLRSVFDFTCDLVQNAAQIGAELVDRHMNPEAFPEWPPETVNWRTAYDEELAEITRQRKERRFNDATDFEPVGAHVADNTTRSGWSRRVRTGEHVPDLIGLALSGGGIRSATFNLGVLQRLQELDLLREIDYLSTVSGGGYIGAWLLGNVRRAHYWLSQLTDWSPSIAHLRRFSNYLAPHSGLMSADTWTMWGSWIRNALLIQLSAATWVCVLLVLSRLTKAVFDSDVFTTLASYPANLILAPPLLTVTLSIFMSLRRQSRSIREWHVLIGAVLPAWIGSFLTAAMLWASRDAAPDTYSEVLAAAWSPWFWPLTLLFASFWIVSALSMDFRGLRPLIAAVPASAALGVVYLGLCGVFWLFGQGDPSVDRYAWYAYAAGPPVVLLVLTAAIVMIIGLIGHDSPDWRREWWTRFGSWLGIYGVGFLSLSITSVFGPLITLWLFQHPWGSVKLGTVLGWVGTVVGGLLTGRSERTSGQETRTLEKAMSWFTRSQR
jgi:hypothetical protein